MTDIIAWGSYDTSKPRVRLLLDELRTQGALAAEINIPVWSSTRDKAVAGAGSLFKALLRLLFAYPGALARLLRQPAGSAVLLAYPAIPDIFIVWPVARSRRHKIVFDAFISLHDTVVADRRMLQPTGLAAKLLWWIERLALRMADIVLADTDQHGDFFAREFAIERARIVSVLVGAEPIFWTARDGAGSLPSHPAFAGGKPFVLFYGQLIPLHGIDVILEAIALTAGEPFHWLLIGSGQEETKLRDFLAEHDGDNVSWIRWVDYEELPTIIAAASVGLGVFGTSDKAGRVIPNKVFQILAAGKPVITRSSPAVDALAWRFPGAIMTAPAGDGAALAAAVRNHIEKGQDLRPLPVAARHDLGPAHGVEELLRRL